MAINLRTIIWFGFLLRLSISIWNGYFGPSFGADSDAGGFHDKGVYYAYNLDKFEFQIGWIYSYFLGLFYYVTLDSLFFGCLLSTITWVLSAKILVKTMRLLSFNEANQINVILVFALLPSSILFTSITLREVFQLFFISLAVLSTMQLYSQKFLASWFILIFSCIGMGILHIGLVIYASFHIVASIFLLAMPQNKRVSLVKILFGIILVAWLCVYGLTYISGIKFDIINGIGKVIENYQMGGASLDGRAQYHTNTKINSFADLVLFIPISVFLYLFEPFPWHVSTISDVFLFFENLLRGWLIIIIFVGFFKRKSENFRISLFCLLVT
jgi:hypothetical protein